jgi:hypothetical protein
MVAQSAIYLLDYSTVNDSVGTVYFNGKTVGWADNPWSAHLGWAAQLFDVIGHPNSSLHADANYCAVATSAIESYLKTKRDLTSKNSVAKYRHPFADILENGPFAKFVLHARALPKSFSQATVERWAAYSVITQKANSCDLDPRRPIRFPSHPALRRCWRCAKPPTPSIWTWPTCCMATMTIQELSS